MGVGCGMVQGPERGMKLVEVASGHMKWPWPFFPHNSHACKNMQGGLKHVEPLLYRRHGLRLRWTLVEVSWLLLTFWEARKLN